MRVFLPVNVKLTICSQSSPQAQDAHIEHASTIPTSSLPDGKPEDEMKNAKEHKLGHVSSIKKIIDS